MNGGRRRTRLELLGALLGLEEFDSHPLAVSAKLQVDAERALRGVDQRCKRRDCGRRGSWEREHQLDLVLRAQAVYTRLASRGRRQDPTPVHGAAAAVRRRAGATEVLKLSSARRDRGAKPFPLLGD